MNAQLKSRLAKLEVTIRPPSFEELSADEKAVLIMLRFQKRILPDWLRAAEERRAMGGRARSPPPAAADLNARWSRVFDRIREANARVGELIAQDRVEGITERLKAWGHWQAPEPPPPSAATIFQRLGELFGWGRDEAHRDPASEDRTTTA